MTYNEFIDDCEVPEILLDTMVEFDNMMEEPSVPSTRLGTSSIHGTGMFTTSNFYIGEEIGKALLKGKRSNLGRYINHSDTPNVVFIVDKVGSDITVKTIRDIGDGEELTVCYGDNYNKQKQVIDYSPMEKMEIYMRSLPGAVEEFDTTTQIFPSSGLGVRYIKMKAGEVLIGKIHKEWNVNILCSGSLQVASNPEEGFVTLTAPQVFETGPGSQKFVMCLTDCVFMNVLQSENETEDEMVNRMAEDTRITKVIEKEKLCQ